MTRPATIAVALALLAAGGVSAAPAPSKPPPLRPSSATPPRVTTAPPAGPKPDLAYGAYQRGLYLAAYREAVARIGHNANDAAAMTLLGELYNQGLGVKRDPKEAASWYRLAANRGEPHAMATLAIMALDGRGIDRNEDQARAWLEKAAAAREPTAAYNLALLLLARGGNDDIARAARLLVVAAEAEIGDAQHALGVLHQRGLGGVARDPTEAARLFLRAARNGSLAGEVEFAIAQFNGDGVPKNEIAASRHFRLAAARGNAIAQNRLARMYATGQGVPKNLVEASAWNLAAASKGLTDSWLDGQTAGLSPADRERAQTLAAERTGQV